MSLTDVIEGTRAKPMGPAAQNRVPNAPLLSLPGLFDTNFAVVNGYAGNWSSGHGLAQYVM